MGIFGDGPPPMAMCRRCPEPLVSTFEFPRYEFYCQACGWKCGFLSPRAEVATPELEARQKELQEQYNIERAEREKAKT